jgi:imidazoleglycerol phosphate synthase glutamine amidotransferase subunit HisH
MRDDSAEEERMVLALVQDYLGGSGSLDAAVAAVRELSREGLDDPIEEAVENEDPLLGIDLSVLTAEQRKRYDDLLLALEAAE